MPEQLKDHEIELESGFYDFQRYPERIAAGTKMNVTADQYKLMKGSDPDSVQLIRVGPPKSMIENMVKAAREEKALKAELAELKADLEDELAELDEPEDWEPIGWYKAQLSKNGGLDE